MTGEISAEESNFNSRKRERIKAKCRGNKGSPREFKHQINIPTWLDRKYVAAYAKKHNIPCWKARNEIFERDY